MATRKRIYYVWLDDSETIRMTMTKPGKDCMFSYGTFDWDSALQMARILYEGREQQSSIKITL